MNKYITIAIIIIIAMLLGLAYYLGINSVKPTIITNEKIIVDTIVKIVHSDPIVLDKVKTKIVYVRDTIIETKPFIASVDTVLNNDTISIKYYYPDNCMDLDIRQSPDSILTEKVYITKEILIEKDCPKNSWWQTSAVGLGGAVIGFILGGIK